MTTSEPGQIDKQTVARRLYASSVRGLVYGNDPLSVHLQIMACYDLLREYAKAKKLPLSHRPTDIIKPEHQNDYIREYLKKPYNFLKHAKYDPDAKLDVAHLALTNDAMLGLVAIMYRDVFGEVSAHMSLFYGYVTLRHPNWIKDAAFEDSRMAALKKFSNDMSEDTILEGCRQYYEANGLSALEVQ